MNTEITFIGLGRMGLAMSLSLAEEGYDVHGYDTNEETLAEAAKAGVTVHTTLTDAINATQSPKTIWLMIPAQYVGEQITALRPLLSAGDTIIDGGNSFFRNSINRQHELLDSQIHFIDCGTSGGVSGARHGASLMVGGDKQTVAAHEHIFLALATENGYGHVGGPGAGHFVKMVHNAIEYGMMGAIAEGINVLHDHKEGLGIDILESLEPYQNGSIISSNLMDWLADAYHKEGYLEKIAGEVPKGETEMEMEYLINTENMRILDAAVLQRKLTRLEPSFTGTLIAAMRNQFGGHKIVHKNKDT